MGKCWTRGATSARPFRFLSSATVSEPHYFTEMCSGSEAGTYLRLIDVVYHSTPGLRVIKKKKRSMRTPNPQPSILTPLKADPYSPKRKPLILMDPELG